MTTSPWDALGISPDASLTEARRAFRARAKLAHPDRGGSEAGFRALLDAFEVVRGALEPEAAGGAELAGGEGCPAVAPIEADRQLASGPEVAVAAARPSSRAATAYSWCARTWEPMPALSSVFPVGAGRAPVAPPGPSFESVLRAEMTRRGIAA